MALRRPTHWSVRFQDRLSSLVITIGGLGVIGAVLGILVYLVWVAAPLFQSPRVTREATARFDAATPLLVQTDEYQSLALRLASDGSLALAELEHGAQLPPPPGLGLPAPILALAHSAAGLCLGLADGSEVSGRLGFQADFPDGQQRRVRPSLELEAPVSLAANDPIDHIDCRKTDASESLVALTRSGRLLISKVRAKKNMLTGQTTRKATSTELPLDSPDKPAFLLLTSRADQLYVAWPDGTLRRYDLGDAPALAETVDLVPEPGASLRALGFPLGEQSLVAADSLGRVRALFRLPLAEHPPRLLGEGGSDGFGLALAHELEPQGAGITRLAFSPRDKSFATADEAGHVWLRHLTSEQTLLRLVAAAPPATLDFTPKADGLIAGLPDGRVQLWRLHSPHPEITARTLWGPVWYEGYAKPGYTWQTSSGTDEFEPKFSLPPLVFGTLKATLCALLFAVPIALCAALYTSEFLDRRLRDRVKPIVEMMASLPSVVLGFFAALLLAPFVEAWVLGVFLWLSLLPPLWLASGLLARRLPRPWPRRLNGRAQLLLLGLSPLVAAALAAALAGPVESLLFGGDFKGWLAEVGWTYAQRNTFLISFVMGFAVIPLIYTIAEDALASVPDTLRSASYGCGATRWQTATRVVLPMATSGIFAAVMVGLGRAVGETMIVLMAAGNTPLITLNPFEGLRAMSANIAVELPEAVAGSTLYRVLFLTALVLFLVTFLVNTAAELVRLRFRKRMSQL